MIIRKPYAFLIRNFRLIHFIMLLFSSFVLFKSFSVLDFFNDYVSTRQFLENANLVNDTIPIWLMLFSFFIIVFATLIVILFNKKDKPTLFYICNIIYYFLFTIICIVSRSIINTIMHEGIDPRISRIIRDFWLIAFVIQIVFVGFYLIRTLGFDVKKFNFGEDVNELKADEEDSEEFELTTRFDSDRVKMRAAMQREELKAFFFENKLVIITIIILLFAVIPSAFMARNYIVNKKYEVGDKIDLKDFTFKITESYITKKDYKGNSLFKGDNSYLIVKFSIENFKEKERGITLDNLRLELNGAVYMPKKTYYEYFTDLGTGYIEQKISKQEKEYIAIYVIDDKELVGDVIIRYADKLTVKKSEVNATYYRFIIKPEDLDSDFRIIKNTLGDEMNLSIKEFKDIKFKIQHYNIKDKFIYEQEGKTKYIINSTGLVLSLNYDFISQSKTTSLLNIISKYGIIRYKVNNIVYYQEISNISPKNYNSNELYLAVSEEMKNATDIELAFNFRNIEYIYKIK